MTKQDCDHAAWTEAEKYLSMSFEKLSELEKAKRTSGDDSPSWIEFGGREFMVEARISTVTGLLGRRISVEVTVSTLVRRESPVVSCVYFERYRSGRTRGPWGPKPRPATLK